MKEVQKCGVIPQWLLNLKDEYQLDVVCFPHKIELRAPISSMRLKMLCDEVIAHGYFYWQERRAFIKGAEKQ